MPPQHSCLKKRRVVGPNPRPAQALNNHNSALLPKRHFTRAAANGSPRPRGTRKQAAQEHDRTPRRPARGSGRDKERRQRRCRARQVTSPIGRTRSCAGKNIGRAPDRSRAGHRCPTSRQRSGRRRGTHARRRGRKTGWRRITASRPTALPRPRQQRGVQGIKQRQISQKLADGRGCMRWEARAHSRPM
jgi:hypothetical protein